MGPICIFTGHRIMRHPHSEIASRLRDHIALLYDAGVHNFASGGALGFDLLAADTVLSMKDRLPQLKLYMILPCYEQDRYFPAKYREQYRDILSRADRIVYTAERYYDGCMLQRNEVLASIAEHCICYLTEKKGGTLHTVGLARRRGVPVINIALPREQSDS